MVLLFPSPEPILTHDLTYPLPQTWRAMLISKQGAKQWQAHFWGLTHFPLGSHQSRHTTYLKREHQQLSQHLPVCFPFTLHSKRHKNKVNPSAAVRTEGYFLAHAGTTAWQGWSFPLCRCQGVWANSLLPEEKRGKTGKASLVCPKQGSKAVVAKAGIISVTDICTSKISWLDSCVLWAPAGSEQLLPDRLHDIAVYHIKRNPGTSSSWN